MPNRHFCRFEIWISIDCHFSYTAASPSCLGAKTQLCCWYTTSKSTNTKKYINKRSMCECQGNLHPGYGSAVCYSSAVNVLFLECYYYVYHWYYYWHCFVLFCFARFLSREFWMICFAGPYEPKLRGDQFHHSVCRHTHTQIYFAGVCSAPFTFSGV